MEENRFRQSDDEQTKESLRKYLYHYPAEERRPNLEGMVEFAQRLGSPISERVGAQSREDGWYVNMPDGTTQRVATFEENPPEHPPRDLFIVYNSNGTFAFGRTVFGAEFHIERME
ncbi:MAG: hypothetical protein WAP52_02025 [Candidatus Sungiibacteriota bacterium]